VSLAFNPRSSAAAAVLLIAAAVSAQAPNGAGRQPAAGKGEVVVATALNEALVQAVVAPFQKQTGIRVSIVRVTRRGAGAAAATLAEDLAKVRGDVWWSPEIATTVRLKALGLLDRVEPPPAGAGAMPKSVHDSEGFWFGFAARARIIMVNTSLVAEADRPRSMWDLLDPKWKGKVVFSRPAGGTSLFHVAALYEVLGADGAERFLGGLERNDCRIAASDAQLAEMIGKGEAHVGMTDTSDYRLVRRQDRPVDAVYPDQDGIGALVMPNTIARLKGGPNEANARALLDYLLGGDAEAILAAHERGHVPLRPSVPHPADVRIPGEFKPMQVDLASAAARAEASGEALRQRFRPRDSRPAVDVLAAKTQVSFDDMPVGAAPAGFTIAQTSGGAPAVWVVKEDATGPASQRVVVQTDMNDTGGRFPMCIYDGVSVKDVSVSARFKANVGDADRAAGLVVRYIDKDNYYCVRANSLEDNVRLYRVVDGRRIQFAGADRILTMEDRWHSLRLDVQGSRFRVWMNGVFLYEAEDSTFPDAGRVGFWLKGDSVTAFDDLEIGPPALRRFADFEAAADVRSAGFVAEAIGGASPIPWVVLSEPSSPAGTKVITAQKGDGGRRGGTVLLDGTVVARDVAVTTHFKVTREGEGMRLAGLVARYRDENNHYYVRVNLHECNVRLYRVSDGTRKLIGEVHHTQFPPDAWHSVQLLAHGRRLAVTIDGQLQFEALDDGLPDAGRVGLWAGTTGGAHFDGVAIESF
jgi:iron(III) transport system substrate-binding protein